MKAFSAVSLIALHLVNVVAVSLPHQACNELATQFPNQLSFPDSLKYVNESNSKLVSAIWIGLLSFLPNTLDLMLNVLQLYGPRIVCYHHGASLRLTRQKTLPRVWQL